MDAAKTENLKSTETQKETPKIDELKQSLDVANSILTEYYNINKDIDYTGKRNTPKDYLDWVDKKTKIIMNSPKQKQFIDTLIKRGQVVWVEFGYNIGDEFSGRHPALVLKNGGRTLIVLPVTSKPPTERQLQSKTYVELGTVYNFESMRRWINILNITNVSIQRVDTKKIRGAVKGSDMDKISKAFSEYGLFKYTPQNK